jgi:hypothetical protein
MRLHAKSFVLAFAATLAAVASNAQVRPDAKVLWLDFDMKNIPEPRERPSSAYDYFFKNQVVEQTKQNLDMVRYIRAAAGHPKRAANVNALDEVPDSSWYTNRHYLHRMTIDDLVRGPNRISEPDFMGAVITKAKTGGVTPGLQLKDRQGDSYIIKFDSAKYPELQSGAEVISTKILYAAGYNVPENYLAYLDPSHLQIGDKVETRDKTGKTRQFTRDDLDEMLQRVARMPDGRYRVLASKFIPGKLKGPFPQVGLRRDDPNDLIPHEHRRELRGLRVIASWINHWDMKEPNGLDTYVEENGRKFLRHYLIDFGSTLGAGRDPTEYFHGRAYLIDMKGILRELFTLGAFKSPEEKQGVVISPAVAMFTSDDFDPEAWSPTYPIVAFDNMTPEDAFWATRIILSFTEPELRSIVETARYSNPNDTGYVLQTLLERRAIVARHWLKKVDALADFSIRPTDGGIALAFHDLMVDSKTTDPAATDYTYRVKSSHYSSEWKTTRNPQIVLDRAILAAAIEREGLDPMIEISIRTNRHGSSSDPVKVYFDWNPTGSSPRIRRVSRG